MEKKKKRYLIGLVLSVFGLAGLITGALLLYGKNPEAFLWAIAVTTIMLLVVSALVKGLEMIFE